MNAINNTLKNSYPGYFSKKIRFRDIFVVFFILIALAVIMLMSIRIVGENSRIQRIESSILMMYGARCVDFQKVCLNNSLENQVPRELLIGWLDNNQVILGSDGAIRFNDVVSSVIMYSNGIDISGATPIGSYQLQLGSSNSSLAIYRMDSKIKHLIISAISKSDKFIPYKR